MPGTRGRHLFTELREQLAHRRGVRSPARLAAWIKQRVQASNPPLYVEPLGDMIRLTHGHVVAYLRGMARAPHVADSPADILALAAQGGEHFVDVWPVKGVPLADIKVITEDVTLTHGRASVLVRYEIPRDFAEDALTAGSMPPMLRRNPAVLVVGANPPDYFTVRRADGAYDDRLDVSMPLRLARELARRKDFRFPNPGNGVTGPLATRVDRLDYRHAQDGKLYTHDFTEDTHTVVAEVEDGGRRVVLRATNGDPIVEDFA